METIDKVKEQEDKGERVHVAVSVNEKPVTFHVRHATGMEIKETAIAQGVHIQRDFVLYEVKGPGKLTRIADDGKVTLHPEQRFRATTPDDNS